jgi:hypothetical protein
LLQHCLPHRVKQARVVDRGCPASDYAAVVIRLLAAPRRRY